jgi:hypothetical protein
MNEENNNIIPENGTIDNTESKKADNVDNAEIINNTAENTSTSAATPVIAEIPSTDNTEKNFNHHEDVSKVKIRTILRQRFKKSSPIFKKVIPLVLVGIICFGVGLMAGKELDRHRNERVLMNRKGIYRQIPNGNFNKRQFNNKNNQQQNNKTPQVTPPATAN